MAINPETQYPGKIAPSTPDYPYGAARNITLPGDGTGTPWEAALVNDLFGWQQSLLNDAGEVPSGSPEKVGASQYLTAMFKSLGLTREDYASVRTQTSNALKDKTSVFVVDQKTGGRFTLDKSDTTTADDNGTVLVDVDGGRWKRDYQSVVSVLWFEAEGGSDSTAAFNAARNALPTSGGRIIVPNDGGGDYILTSDILAGGKPLEWDIELGAGVTGGVLQARTIERRPNTGIDLQKSYAEDDFSPWQSSVGYALKTVAKTSIAGGLPFISAVLNDSPAETVSFPTAVTGYARVENDGNQGFGIFGRVDTYASRGTPKNELNVFNESGVDADVSTQATGIGGVTTTLQLPICLLLAAGGDSVDARDSGIGLAIGSEGGSTTGFKGGICIDPAGCKDYGISITGENTRHIRLIDTRESAAVGPSLYLERDSASPAGGDDLGSVIFNGRNSNDDEYQYGQILTSIRDAAQGVEDSRMRFNVSANGAVLGALELDGFANNNPVSLVVEGALKQVVAGAADSGGAGYRVLRVLN